MYVIASLQESFGQTVSESLACGTPVAGFASGGIKDMVRPGITGYLAPTGDAEALRDAVLRAVRDDPATRCGMAENCRRIAVEEYSLERKVEVTPGFMRRWSANARRRRRLARSFPRVRCDRD